jgi:hypothetical protein
MGQLVAAYSAEFDEAENAQINGGAVQVNAVDP